MAYGLRVAFGALSVKRIFNVCNYSEEKGVLSLSLSLCTPFSLCFSVLLSLFYSLFLSFSASLACAPFCRAQIYVPWFFSVLLTDKLLNRLSPYCLSPPSSSCPACPALPCPASCPAAAFQANVLNPLALAAIVVASAVS